MLGWLVAAAVDRYKRDGKFFIFLTSQSYILLTLSLLLLAILTAGYAAFCCSGDERVSPPSYNQDRIAWYIKMSWFLHTSASVLALGVTFSYWLLLCTLVPGTASLSNVCNVSTEPTCATFSNATTEPSCRPNPTNLHLHGINAAIVILDIWMSRIPFQLLHCFYSTIFTTLYLIFSLIYWVAHGRTREGVIYAVLDYSGNKVTCGFFATLLLLMPPLFYLVLFAIAKSRDVTCLRLRHYSCSTKDVTCAETTRLVEGETIDIYMKRRRIH